MAHALRVVLVMLGTLVIVATSNLAFRLYYVPPLIPPKKVVPTCIEAYPPLSADEFAEFDREFEKYRRQLLKPSPH